MNRKDLQALADRRLNDSQVLFKNRCFDGAYYLAGYVVECAIKACIAKKTRRHDFPPDKDYVFKVYTHSLVNLLAAAGLAKPMHEEFRRDPNLESKWDVVKDWNEHSRYASHGRKKAQDMLNAVGSPLGVFECLKRYW